MSRVPQVRIAVRNDVAANTDGEFVLYWMIAARRARWNYALDRAIEWARELGKPLVVLEALRSGYPWASDRLHAFVIAGMADNARAFAGRVSRARRDAAPAVAPAAEGQGGALYYPYVEPRAGAGRGLVGALARAACVVVTDDFPCFFLPRMVDAAAKQIPVRFEAVDSNGVFPLRATDRVFVTAASFRRVLHRELPPHLAAPPSANPLARLRLPRLDALPRAIAARWPAASPELLGAARDGDAAAIRAQLASFDIDHAVAPVDPAVTRGGAESAAARLDDFVAQRLARYNDARTDLAERGTSGLSAYLHFGHVSAHQILDALARETGWSAESIDARRAGERAAWWSAADRAGGDDARCDAAAAFLDELITWREIGYNMASHTLGYDRYETLPEWARATLAEHASDPREERYTPARLEAAATHDPLWNAAQRQLARDGVIHNYVRMLWGKKILEWSRTPQIALNAMIHLNNKYALDGRNPNSYSGIFWCLGRYDRPWGPKRPIFGSVRYMSSDNTARKMDVKPYLARYGPSSRQESLAL
ncbi:MAG: deoxyribodipyrimidine photolyase [bacterium]